MAYVELTNISALPSGPKVSNDTSVEIQTNISSTAFNNNGKLKNEFSEHLSCQKLNWIF